MPRTRSLAWSELKIGVVIIVAIVIAAATIFALTGTKGFFWERYNLKARFSNVAGLNPGSPVRLAGVEVGEVDRVAIVDEAVEVVFQVNKSHRDRITTSSIAKLGSVSLLGESAVDIAPSASGTPIPEWGYVPTGPAPRQLSDLTDSAGQGITQLTELIQDVRAGRGTVGKLMTDEQLYSELTKFAATAGELTSSIRLGQGTLGRLITDRKAADALEASLKNVEELSRRLKEGEGSLGKLLKDDGFARSLSSTTSNIDELVKGLNRGEGSLGKLLHDPVVFNQLDSMTKKLDRLMTDLNAGEGTAGRLLKDKQLYENINGTMSDLRALIANINKDPRKYLNVRVSIF
jgi:phospholipid/cholesterol/gamma-HCH transport system substrate-binding protein